MVRPLQADALEVMNELERVLVDNRAMLKKLAREGERTRELKTALQTLFSRQLASKRKKPK